MHRYVFNSYSCRWEIQLLCWGFLWRTVRGRSFESLRLAKDFAEGTGICLHYREQQPYRHAMIIQEQADGQS